MRSHLWTLVLVFVVSAYSFCETPEKVTACKLKNDPAAFNHKLVEVEGFISHAFEDFTFFDPNCPYSPMIWLEYGGKASSGTMYCCGVSNARSRPKELAVDGVPISLIDDERFRQLDKLIHDEADTVVHATLVGRFFAGKREKYANGKSGNWGGYGHMGCCSLLAIQQVVSVDPHDRDDLDYRVRPDEPAVEGMECRTFLDRRFVPSARATFDIQHRAEAGENVWVFDDPRNVATSVFAESLRINEKEITGLTETKSRGRVAFQWHPPGKTEEYMVVVSRPYWLSFYAADGTRVAWVVISAYEACGD
jgi:hypothetical protein